MKLLVVSVYDSAVKAYSTPYFFRTKAEAVRSFSTSVNDGKQFLSPGDYTMYCLGEFDDQSGYVECVQAPEKLISALECLALKDK